MAEDASDREFYQAVAEFERSARWGLLSSLAWIATRDMGTTYRASLPDETIEGANFFIALETRPPNATYHTLKEEFKDWRPVTVTEVWARELAPALASAKLSGIGFPVSGATARIERRHAAKRFPQEPASVAGLEPLHRRGAGPVVLAVSKSRAADQWRDWHDITFSASDVQSIWPAVPPQVQPVESPPPPPAPEQVTPLTSKRRSLVTDAVEREMDRKWPGGLPQKPPSVLARMLNSSLPDERKQEIAWPATEGGVLQAFKRVLRNRRGRSAQDN